MAQHGLAALAADPSCNCVETVLEKTFDGQITLASVVAKR